MKPIKKMLLYLLAFGLIGTAQADVIGFIGNKGGGRIAFTDEACNFKGKNYPNLRKVYAYSSDGVALDGCYAIENETAVVIWEDGEKRRYMISNIQLVR